MLDDAIFMRYSRQLLLEEIGNKGQQKLTMSKVLIVGLGGLGSPAALYLAAAGVGELWLADNDKLHISNLQRQILYHTQDVSQLKVTLAAKQLNQLNPLNPQIKVKTFNTKQHYHSLRPLVRNTDLVLDCTDNMSTRQAINAECEALRSIGYNNLLLVTGEHPSKVGMNYFRQYIPLIKKYFSTLLMEVQPLTITEYSELKEIGLDGVLVYQETYQQHHLRGKKQDFFWRLETPDRLGQAGIDKIGLGALIGLSDNWRVDYYLVANHLSYLQKKYWKSRYSISFPRIRACIGGIQPASTIHEAKLIQLICAFRLLAPEVELSLSTRESPFFRDNIIPLVINTLSAGSKTQPGGYADNHQALEQFTVYDNRSAETMAKVIINAGLQPVWKDWDHHLGR